MEEKKPKISVIVPVYNVEKYLHKCVDSILKQTLSDIELILVDDGSPDGSGAICDEYAQKDSRVKVIHKPNGGVSSARNAGIKVAKGEWLCFVDSDDWIDETYLEDFGVDKGDADMYMQGYKRLYNGQVVATTGFDGFNSDKFDDVLAYSETNHIINSPCFKLYKNELVASNKLRFDTNTSYGEDHLFSLSYVIYAKSINYSKGKGYNYITYDSESLTNRKIPSKQMIYYISEVERLSDKLLEKNKSEVLQMAFDETFVDNVIRAVRYCFYEKPQYEEYCEMASTFDFTKHNFKGVGYKRRFAVGVLRYLPLSVTFLIFRMLNSLGLL